MKKSDAVLSSWRRSRTSTLLLPGTKSRTLLFLVFSMPACSSRESRIHYSSTSESGELAYAHSPRRPNATTIRFATDWQVQGNIVRTSMHKGILLPNPITSRKHKCICNLFHRCQSYRIVEKLHWVLPDSSVCGCITKTYSIWYHQVSWVWRKKHHKTSTDRRDYRTRNISMWLSCNYCRRCKLFHRQPACFSASERFI